MNLINQSAEVWKQGDTIADIWEHIARCTRVCYQTEKQNDGETGEEFCRRTILKNEPLNSPKNHLAMLEHGTIYLRYITKWTGNSFVEKYRNNPYSKVHNVAIPENDKNYKSFDGWVQDEFYITTNLRVLVENNWLDDLKYLCAPTKAHFKRYTVSCITNIGVSREFNRHRVHSIAEESTRYCNYNKRNDGQITFVVPAWWDGPTGKVNEFINLDDRTIKINNEVYQISTREIAYLYSLKEAEYAYNVLIKNGWKPQQAREVLPLATKTQLIHTAFVDDWDDFLALRYEGISGTPHPNMKSLAKLIKDELDKIVE